MYAFFICQLYFNRVKQQQQEQTSPKGTLTSGLWYWIPKYKNYYFHFIYVSVYSQMFICPSLLVYSFVFLSAYMYEYLQPVTIPYMEV